MQNYANSGEDSLNPLGNTYLKIKVKLTAWPIFWFIGLILWPLRSQEMLSINISFP